MSDNNAENILIIAASVTADLSKVKKIAKEMFMLWWMQKQSLTVPVKQLLGSGQSQIL